MVINFLLLIIVFLAITSNLGFFTVPAFLILTFLAILLMINLIFPKRTSILNVKVDDKIIPLFFYVLVLFSGIYYGGLYQDASSIVVGNYIIYGLLIFIFYYQFIFNKQKYILLMIISGYLFLAIFTLINSPAPVVDTFVLFKEAPLSLLAGKNPYAQTYSQVYRNIINHFPYLPFSLFYTLPFLLVFNDPRYGIIFANLLSVFIMYKLFRRKTDKKILYSAVFAFLFLPRSFYILEHMYLDPIIFSFFVLFFYFYKKNQDRWAFLFLALSYSFKFHIIFLTLPFLITKSFLKRFITNKNYLFFIVPLIIPLIFLIINPPVFLNNYIRLIPNSTISYIGPTALNLSLTNFLNKTILSNQQSLSSLLGMILFITSFISIIFRKNKLSVINKIISCIFFFQYFTYMSFFNHYYLLALFVFFGLLFTFKT